MIKKSKHSYWLGKKRSQATKDKISASKKIAPFNHKNGCCCPICQSKIGNAKRGKDHPMYGRDRTNETKLIESNKDPEKRKRISKTLMNHPVSLKTRIKVSAHQQGIPINEWNGFLSRQEISKRTREKHKSDPRYRLNNNMSTVVYRALNGTKQWKKWQDILGYTIEDLMVHIEKQFDNKINWSNYGFYWEIDHIIPKSWFIYTKPEDVGFKMCWDLDNLQPLEKSINRHKHNSFVLIRTNTL